MVFELLLTLRLVNTTEIHIGCSKILFHQIYTYCLEIHHHACHFLDYRLQQFRTCCLLAI
ncbi:hypothetical protein TRIATDRAFT_297526, partial [Trichoderma atroviride IMI 206040]